MELITVKRPIPDYVRRVYSNKIREKIERVLTLAYAMGFTKAEIAQDFQDHKHQLTGA